VRPPDPAPRTICENDHGGWAGGCARVLSERLAVLNGYSTQGRWIAGDLMARPRATTRLSFNTSLRRHAAADGEVSNTSTRGRAASRAGLTLVVRLPGGHSESFTPIKKKKNWKCVCKKHYLDDYIEKNRKKSRSQVFKIFFGIWAKSNTLFWTCTGSLFSFGHLRAYLGNHPTSSGHTSFTFNFSPLPPFAFWSATQTRATFYGGLCVVE